MEDFVLNGEDLSVDAVDITTSRFKGGMDPVYLRKFRDFAFKNGLPFSGEACGSNLPQAKEVKREKACDEAKSWIDGTEALGASHLRIRAGPLAPGMTEAQGVDPVAEAVRSLCDYSVSRGIALGVETHWGTTQKAEVAVEIIRGVNIRMPESCLTSRTFWAITTKSYIGKLKAAFLMAPRRTFGRVSTRGWTHRLRSPMENVRRHGRSAATCHSNMKPKRAAKAP